MSQGTELKCFWDYTDEELELKVTAFKNAIACIVSAKLDMSEHEAAHGYLVEAKAKLTSAIMEIREHQVRLELIELEGEE